jgi:hypothetical protein
MPTSDRVLRAQRQEAALRKLAKEEKRATQKAEASERLRYGAAEIRRKALAEARATGVTAAELAETLQVSVQRIYQLLSDAGESARTEVTR